MVWKTDNAWDLLFQNCHTPPLNYVGQIRLQQIRHTIKSGLWIANTLVYLLSIANSVSFGSLKIAEYASQCPPLVPPIFGRRFDISQFTSHLSPIDFVLPPFSYRATCLLCLNWMWVPLQSVPLQCFNVSTQICCRPPFANSSCLPAQRPIVLKSHLDLFTNHCWICSPTVCAFVPNQLWTWV